MTRFIVLIFVLTCELLPEGGEAKWVKQGREKRSRTVRVKDRGRRGRRGRRSEADLIHRFDFIIRDEANRK